MPNVLSTSYHYGATQAPFVVLPPPQFTGHVPIHGGQVQFPQSPVQLIKNALPPLPEPARPSIDLVRDTLKVLVTELPAPVKTLDQMTSAGAAAKKLTDNINQALKKGESKEEAVICQTVKTVTEEVIGTLAKDAIVGGIPAYLEAATLSPPLAATIPFVVPLIPKAYRGAETTAQYAGQVAEAGCHKGFELARQLSKKGDGQ